MKHVFNRILKMAKAESLHQLHKLEARLFSKHFTDRHYEEYRFSNAYSSKKSGMHQKESYGEDFHSRSSEVPWQVFEDLGIFNLKPPASLEEIKKARNREFRKYHSDRFINDPEKYQTSKEIMQIYNAAYERLHSYYKKRQQRK